jgi:hypothetical protein
MPIMRKKFLLGLAAVAFVIGAFALHTETAQANVTKMVLHRRNCNLVSAYAYYDGFSGGSGPSYVVFTADLDGDGTYGAANEPKVYVRLNTKARQPYLVNRVLRFNKTEGTVISVMTYEVDSTGQQAGDAQTVSYTCANRPAFDPLPPDTGIVIPGIGITTRIKAEQIKVYAGPSAEAELIDGVGVGQVFNVLAINKRGDWILIDLGGGRSGWIMWQTQAQIFGPAKSLPIRE